MLHLKVALIEPKYGDEQYVESSLEAGGFPVTMVTDEKAWAVKAPSRECVQQVQSLIPGCEVRVFHHVRYLMSPKALLYYPVQDIKKDVVLLTFDFRGCAHFLMVHMAGRHFWHLPWCERDQLHVFLSTAFTLLPDAPLSLKVSWKVLKQHHQVIDWKTFIHFRLFHCHLQLAEVQALLTHCGAPHLEGVLPLTTPQTFVTTSTLFHSIMVVPKACVTNIPATIDGTAVDQWHLDAANRAYNTPKRTHRRMQVYSTIN